MNSEDISKASKFYSYLKKYVNIRLKPEVSESESMIRELSGWIYTIDPVDET